MAGRSPAPASLCGLYAFSLPFIWKLYAPWRDCADLSTSRLDMFDIFYLALGVGFFLLTLGLMRMLGRVS